ncbi:rRNA-processing protein FCF2 [Cordyceps fumosorosea ARSEF 2679]|uniref:rRNA-processing protein FCF2 n=1 Tax=Cordyceps fumosorosea (strain ARSEF 2679) TaxID=1081104 RepID=A0A167MIN9_CORFA|nr:rRNA-processing protein FCF2 [Cordyceps fumosorosea ARSEF 2679]OAA54404.1 rRNA-processing protein FCF2 [Cordyceps fumosorosea ARSEF 2679]
MAKISSQQISELLLEAEQRLEGASASTVPTSDVVVDEAQAVPPVTAAVPGGKEGSVRIAQHYKASGSKAKDSAGSDWFDLPKTVLTPEFKRDWQVLRMRGLLDPKHQKKALRAEAPKYSQVGQIIEGPTDFFSARLTRKERQQTIFGEVMKDHARDKLKSKYGAIQKKQMSGKKAFYQELVAQRRKGRG